jgi:hypothetical protein
MKPFQDLRTQWKLARRSRKKMRFFRSADIILVAYAKSGRTWLSVMISHIAHQKFGTPAEQLISSSEFREANPELPNFFLTADNFAPPGLGEPALLALYRERKVVLLVRDPRDIAVSLYFQLSRRASPLARAVFEAPDNLEEMTLFDFVCDESVGLPRVIEWLNRWRGRIDEIPEGLVITYEDLRAETPRILGQTTDLIGWQCSEYELQAAVDFAAFDKLKVLEKEKFFQSRRMQPRDAQDSSTFKVRRGKVGGYRDDFTPEQIARIDALVTERIDPRLGYGQRPDSRSDPGPAPGPAQGRVGGA